MTPRGDRGSSASVHARLLDGARERGEEFQSVLVRYAIERFLYRLACSDHADRFVLKGATLFAVWAEVPHRPTKDVDLLGFGPPSEERLAQMMREVVTADVERDGLAFDPESVRVAPIREGAEYHGLRTTTLCHLGSARIGLQIDVGYGDALALPPEEIEVPTLLDLPAPRLRGYRREQVVAEKVHAIVALGLLNTRMKDYFDVHALARGYEFDAEELRRAMEATFERRKTPLPTSTPDGLEDAFGADPTKVTQWRAFLRRIGASEPAALTDVVVSIRPFVLEPLRMESPAIWYWPPRGPWTAR